MRVGFIGLGAIGQGLLRYLGPSDGIEVVGAVVRDLSKPRQVPVPVVASSDELLALGPELVVEMGGHAALACHGPPVLRAGVDLLMVSVGALAEPSVETAIVEAARAGHAQARVACGAIGALDAIAAAAVGGLERVTHTTRKPARTLLKPEEVARLGNGPREIFRGSARQGALLFPESINVAAAVSLAGLGLDRTEVCVIADPSVQRNQHEVVAEGFFGRLRFEIHNVPTDENPRTGRLVAMSLAHALRARRAALSVG